MMSDDGGQMTWIVGSAGVWAPFIAGDIRVTWTRRNGTPIEHDCLQKIYPVSENILGGFAGSVSLGFRILDAIAAQTDAKPSLRRIAHLWLPRLMRRSFNSAAPNERAMGSHFIFVGYHPALELMPGLPQTQAFYFRSPRFEPRFIRSHKCLGIGSGNLVETLRNSAEDAYARFSQLRMNARSPGLCGHLMANHFRDLLRKQPARGVSEWFVFGTVTPQGGLLRPLSYRTDGAEGPELVEAPSIAKSRKEFESFAKTLGLRATAACA